eukprot:scaffold14192_cov80-Phaeocystis_antarctica.AAC.1
MVSRRAKPVPQQALTERLARVLQRPDGAPLDAVEAHAWRLEAQVFGVLLEHLLRKVGRPDVLGRYDQHSWGQAELLPRHLARHV